MLTHILLVTTDGTRPAELSRLFNSIPNSDRILIALLEQCGSSVILPVSDRRILRLSSVDRMPLSEARNRLLDHLSQKLKSAEIGQDTRLILADDDCWYTQAFFDAGLEPASKNAILVHPAFDPTNGRAFAVTDVRGLPRHSLIPPSQLLFCATSIGIDMPALLGLSLRFNERIGLEWSQDGTRATAVIVNHDGVLHRVPGEQIVIAAGALESPVILLNSPGGEAGGRYNLAGHAGRYLGDHPMAFVGKVRVLRPKRAPLFSDMFDGMGNRVRIGLRPADISKYGNSNLYLRPSFGERRNDVDDKILLSLASVRSLSSIRIKDLVNILAHPKVAYRAVANRFALPLRYRHADLFFVTEQGSEATSRVQLSARPVADGLRDADYHWVVPESDLQRLGVMFREVVKPSLQTSNLALTVLPTIEHWRDHFTSAAHHLGTMRMSAGPEDGVVSTDLQLHGAKNVWVCDGSVFPSVGNANPSLTICALAHRLFEHLQPRLRHVDALADPGYKDGRVLPKALLTGATGFIGRAITKRAEGRMSLLSGVRVESPTLQSPGRIRIDLSDDRSVFEAVVGCNIVIHAAYDSCQPEREGEFARRLVEAGLRQSARTFVFFGTYSTYDALRDHIDEASPNSSIRLPYIVGKLALERTLRELSDTHPEARIVLLQPTIVTGGGGSWDHFFERMGNAPAVLLPHGGASPLNAISVNEVAEAAIRASLDTTSLPAGFHKYLLNGHCDCTWAERILSSSTSAPPRIAPASRNLLAEGLITNLLLCVKYASCRRWWYPNWQRSSHGAEVSPAHAVSGRHSA